MTCKITDTQNVMFVSLYQSHPILWDTTSIDYKNKNNITFFLYQFYLTIELGIFCELSKLINLMGKGEIIIEGGGRDFLKIAVLKFQ